METRPKVSGESEPLKKAIGAAKRQSGHQKNLKFFCLRARHMAANTKLGLRSSKATIKIQYKQGIIDWVKSCLHRQRR